MTKALTLIFCNGDGDVGKEMALQIRTDDMQAYLRDAGAFSGDGVEPCDRVIFTPAVPAERRQLIMDTYKITHDVQEREREQRVEQMEFAPASIIVPEFVEPEVPAPAPKARPKKAAPVVEEKQEQTGAKEPLTFKHITQGRWYVMRGKERVSGPHTKEEARRLAQHDLLPPNEMGL